MFRSPLGGAGSPVLLTADPRMLDASVRARNWTRAFERKGEVGGWRMADGGRPLRLANNRLLWLWDQLKIVPFADGAGTVAVSTAVGFADAPITGAQFDVARPPPVTIDLQLQTLYRLSDPELHTVMNDAMSPAFQQRLSADDRIALAQVTPEQWAALVDSIRTGRKAG